MVAPNDHEPLTEDSHFVSQESADEIARAFFGGDEPTYIGSDAGIGMRAAGEDGVSLPSYYIYTHPNGGYVIVSATEAAYPILGYSREGSVDLKNLPCGLRMLLGFYSQDIKQARISGVEPATEIMALRSALRAKDPVGNVVVAPLMSDIHWDQMPYYNALCPSSNVPVGCVATATSQIMRYWEYPEVAKGHYAYNCPNFGTLSHDYNYTINWKEMPKATLKETNFAIARFCYGVAVSVDMQFDYAHNGGSGAKQNDVPFALIRFYSYPKSVTSVFRNYFSDDDWMAMMQNELDNKRPIQYGGQGSGGGHSFVLDGYDDKGYFHVNWGWSGNSDGWFKLDALDPDDLGTGGGSGGFNKYQQAIINFAPPAVVEGDNNDPIVDNNNDPEIGGVTYNDVFVLNANELFIRYTCFNGVKTFSSALGYASYFDKKIYVGAGETINYEVEPEVVLPDAKPAYLIAIDYDNSGDFSIEKGSTELVVMKKMGNTDTLKGSFTLPNTLKKGVYRMRVIISDNGIYDPNKPHVSGEFEDYQITIR